MVGYCNLADGISTLGPVVAATSVSCVFCEVYAFYLDLLSFPG
jgi:hypothetical protein